MPYNPRSLENLRPAWKLGESGNPEGRAFGNYGHKRRFENMMIQAFNSASKRDSVSEEPAPVIKKELPEPRPPCTVCRHGERAVIDGLLTLGIPLRVIARSYGFSKSSTLRHKQRHLSIFPDTEKAREIMNGEKLLSGPIYFLRRADDLYRGRLQDCAWRVLCDLWESLVSTFGSNPTGRLQLVGLEAIVHLAYISARNGWDDKQNRGDLQTALQALESWDHGAGTTRARKNVTSNGENTD